ncbi:MAG TPA: hypothetical protein PKC14_03255, partial [Candidatus Absconditabacterales bacterium]|nr:hypothetical protein [Candidatus Absconditabacterales bacterium]
MQIKKFFIKIFSFLFVAFLGLGGFLMADFQEFQRQLGSMGLVSEDFMKKPAISRYELSRLLNAVECKDCVNPDKSMIDSYSQQFWNQFVKLPGKDFSDIFYRQAVYNQQSYFYCVAYVGDNQYMRGYPLATSPLCAG